MELTRTGLPLGMFQHQSLQQRAIRLEPGDLLFLYTDGLLDATDPHGQAFGSERLRELMLEHRQAPASALAAAIEQAIRDFRGDGPLFDDITFVIVKRAERTHFTYHASAALDQLANIRNFVSQSAARLGASPKARDDLELAVDELVTNIISHGYRQAPQDIEIVVQREAEVIVVLLRDEAPPFDPTQVAAPDITLPLHLRPEGGLGIFLARRVTDSMTYRRTNDHRNEITLTKKISSTSEAST
jgi:anti-sigma regulatory factor (Ser/Thr protein kinase)